MLEALIIPLVFHTLPTIFPISIQKSSSLSSSPPHTPKMKRRMEQAKGLALETTFPSIFTETLVGLFDNMCCFAYGNEQVSAEAGEVEYHEDSSVLDSVYGEEEDHFTKSVKSTQRPEECPREYLFLESPQARPKASLNAHDLKRPAPGSSSTATTVTMQTYYSTSSSESWTTDRSDRLVDDERELIHDQIMAPTPQIISVPSSRSQEQGRRRWSEPSADPMDHQQELPSEEMIRQVQSESLAKLPYLSMTEGYRC